MARITLENDAAEAFDQLPRPINARMQKVLQRLERWPEVSGAKPLRGDLAGRYRVRTGDYRLRFRVEGDEVIVERIGHRKSFYEG